MSNERIERIDLEALAQVVGEELRDRVETNPWITLAGAAGFGYILGAGVPNFVLRAGSAYAMRMVTSRVVGGLVERGARSDTPDVVVDDPPAEANG